MGALEAFLPSDCCSAKVEVMVPLAPQSLHSDSSFMGQKAPVVESYFQGEPAPSSFLGGPGYSELLAASVPSGMSQVIFPGFL